MQNSPQDLLKRIATTAQSASSWFSSPIVRWAICLWLAVACLGYGLALRQFSDAVGLAMRTGIAGNGAKIMDLKSSGWFSKEYSFRLSNGPARFLVLPGMLDGSLSEGMTVRIAYTDRGYFVVELADANAVGGALLSKADGLKHLEWLAGYSAVKGLVFFGLAVLAGLMPLWGSRALELGRKRLLPGTRTKARA